jgi:hypothetical protein
MISQSCINPKNAVLNTYGGWTHANQQEEAVAQRHRRDPTHTIRNGRKAFVSMTEGMLLFQTLTTTSLLQVRLSVAIYSNIHTT